MLGNCWRFQVIPKTRSRRSGDQIVNLLWIRKLFCFRTIGNSVRLRLGFQLQSLKLFFFFIVKESLKLFWIPNLEHLISFDSVAIKKERKRSLFHGVYSFSHISLIIS